MAAKVSNNRFYILANYFLIEKTDNADYSIKLFREFLEKKELKDYFSVVKNRTSNEV
jgi:hypothetical protein